MGAHPRARDRPGAGTHLVLRAHDRSRNRVRRPPRRGDAPPAGREGGAPFLPRNLRPPSLARVRPLRGLEFRAERIARLPAQPRVLARRPVPRPRPFGAFVPGRRALVERPLARLLQRPPRGWAAARRGLGDDRGEGTPARVALPRIPDDGRRPPRGPATAPGVGNDARTSGPRFPRLDRERTRRSDGRRILRRRPAGALFRRLSYALNCPVSIHSFLRSDQTSSASSSRT